MRDKNYGYSNREIEEINNSGDTYFGYLEYIRRWPFLSRLITSVTFTSFILGIPFTIIGLLTYHYDPDIIMAMCGYNNIYNSIWYLIATLVIISIVLFTSKFGLDLVDAWFTPRYEAHLSRRHPKLDEFDIDIKAIKHIKIFSNIFRVIGYIIFSYFAIFYLIIGCIILGVLEGIFTNTDGRTYHFTKSHWY